MTDRREILTIRDLVVQFGPGAGSAKGLDQVSLTVHDGDMLGIVGETGSGKSLTLLSIMGLLPHPARITSGSIRYRGRELTLLGREAYRELRGREIGVVVQNAKAALNPLARIGHQMRAVYEAKTQLRGDALARHARDILSRVGFRDPDRVMNAYPHQISGGMAQRVVIAIALGPSPQLVLFDEPTSGLDATVAVQVMETIRHTIRQAGASAIIVTHDLGVVGRYCDHVALMSAGRVVDSAPVSEFFAEDTNPHRKQLIEAHAWAVAGAERGDADAARTREGAA